MDHTLSDSMKLWALLCRATQDGWVIVESSGKTWSTGKGKDKPLNYSCLENPMNSMKMSKGMTLKDEHPSWVGAGERWRSNSKKNEETSQNENNTQLWMWLVMEVKVWCCKEQYCIETWNIRFMNQSKLEVVKQEMVRVSIPKKGSMN